MTRCLGIILCAYFLFGCAAYQRNTERYYVAVAKKEFKRLETSTDCDFDLTTPVIRPSDRSYWNPLSKILYYQRDYPKEIVHEMSHSAVSPLLFDEIISQHDRLCLSEVIAQLIYDNYSLRQKVRRLTTETQGFGAH